MRELEIKMFAPWQKWHWLGVILGGLAALFVLAGLAAIAIRIFFNDGRFEDSPLIIIQMLYFVGYTVHLARRARYLKSQYVKIDDEGVSWRLFENFISMQLLRPIISERTISWTALRAAKKEASGFRFTLLDGQDAFIPLSFLSYAQRQDINKALTLHMQEQSLAPVEQEQGVTEEMPAPIPVAED